MLPDIVISLWHNNSVRKALDAMAVVALSIVARIAGVSGSGAPKHVTVDTNNG